MDYAKKENRQALLRHPVLGDPSFDTFEKLGDTVHRSQPPMSWAVNGSLFRDFDGSWYYYAGLYSYGYVRKEGEPYSHFLIYRSRDKGRSWECLGDPFDRGFVFEGHSAPSDSHPDAVLSYYPKTRRYLLAYDYGNNNDSWDLVYRKGSQLPHSGAALAWAEHPAGPFHRLERPIFSNRELEGLLGRYCRMYATTVIPRERDYLALVLCDSNQYFAWALAAMTAPSIEGPWSRPQLLLSPDLPGYYPAPMEFFPAHVIGDTVYAPAPSVAKNRNYQCLYAAPLEQAHLAQAWRLAQDGSLWHSRRDPDEHYGIWGQTFHGFVEEGRMVVMYPSKDREDRGTLSVAVRPADQPVSDGFTFSGHGGPSLTLTYASYAQFRLKARFTLSGTLDVGFGYRGVLGPDRPASDAEPHRQALASCTLLRLTAAPEGEQGGWQVLRLGPCGEETRLAQGEFPGRPPEEPIGLELSYQGERLSFSLDGAAHSLGVGPVPPGPLALMARRFSLMACSRFQVEGEALPYRLFHSAKEGLLGAGQNRKDWLQEGTGEWFSGEGTVAAKWNVTGDRFTIWCPKGPGYGSMGVYLDGRLLGTAVLYAEQEQPSGPVFSTGPVPFGPHSVTVRPYEGRIAIDRLESEGAPQAGEA